jgi:ABC-type branched-subunit amino acid transport system substrate-binding protein
MPTATVKSGDEFQQDATRLAKQIVSHLNAVASHTSGRAGDKHGGVPVNLTILVTAILIGLILVAIIRIRGVGKDNPVIQSASVAVTQGSDELIIGVAVGVSGASAPQGSAMVNGIQLALDESPSILVADASFPVSIVVLDTRCSALGGIEVAKLFVGSNVAGVIGHQCERSCAASESVYDEAGYTAISPSCNSPGLTLDSSSFNRTAPSQSYAGVVAADFVVDVLQIPRTAVISDELILGGQLASAFAEQFVERGGEISGIYHFETTALNLNNAMDDVLQAEPQMIYFAGRASTAVDMLQIIDDAGLVDVPIVVGMRDEAEAFLRLAGNSATDRVYTMRLLPPDTPALNQLAEQYQARFNFTPDDPIFAYSYDAMNMFLNAVQQIATVDVDGKLIVDRARLQEVVRAYQGEGVTGTLACDASGDCATAAYSVLVIRDGEWVEYTQSTED